MPNVETFGAIGDGITDDWAAIMRGIEFCLTGQPGPPVLEFELGKTYRISQPLIIARKNAAGTDFEFATMTLTGPEIIACYALPDRPHPTIVMSDPRYPVVIVHYGRGVLVRGLVLVGQNTAPYSYSSNPLTSAPLISDGVANGQYSPHAGIVTDPFNPALAVGDRYPGLDSWYIGAGQGGSSRTRVEDCTLTQFAVGAVFSVGGMAQGDDYQVRDSYAVACDVGWCVGSTQTRGGNFWDVSSQSCRYHVINTLYGQKLGEMPNISGGQVSQVKYLFSAMNMGWGGFNCNGLYAEDVHSLGAFMGPKHVANFTGCQFNLSGSTPWVDYHLITNTQAVFTGCSFNHESEPLRFIAEDTGNALFSGCSFFGAERFAPPRLVLSAPERFRFVNCMTGAETVPFSDLVTVNSRDSLEGTPVHNEARVSAIDHLFQTRVRPQSYTRGLLISGATHYRLDGAGRRVYDIATVDADWLSTAMVGDLLVTTDQQVAPELSDGEVIRTVGLYAAYIAAISGTEVTLDGVIESAFSGGTPNLAVWSWPLYHSPAWGDVAQGSNLVANVSRPDLWQVGERIQAALPDGSQSVLPAGTYVQSIQGSTLMLSANASGIDGFAPARVRLYDADLEEVGASDRAGMTYHIRRLLPPVVRTVDLIGPAGSTSYAYFLVAVDAFGRRSLPSPGFVFATGPAVISSGNHCRVVWKSAPGAVAYDILRGDTQSLAGRVLLGGSSQAQLCEFHDSNPATTAYFPATSDETGNLTVDGVVTAHGETIG